MGHPRRVTAVTSLLSPAVTRLRWPTVWLASWISSRVIFTEYYIFFMKMRTYHVIQYKAILFQWVQHKSYQVGSLVLRCKESIVLLTNLEYMYQTFTFVAPAHQFISHWKSQIGMVTLRSLGTEGVIFYFYCFVEINSTCKSHLNNIIGIKNILIYRTYNTQRICICLIL